MNNLTLSDGRKIQYIDTGIDTRPVVVAHHGTPSEAGVWLTWKEAIEEVGFRLIALTRPGYAGSDRDPGRSVAKCATDVREVLDAIGVDLFVSLGWSGGGPHALACAALLPRRCKAVATLAGFAPYGVEDLSFMEGMGAENIREFAAAIEGERALTIFNERENVGLREITPDSLFSTFGSLLPPVDQDAINSEFIQALANTIRAALGPGFSGQIDDGLAFVRDWGFSVESVRVPSYVWQGGLDTMVPFAHGVWLSKHLPNCVARLEPNQGHISLIFGNEIEILRDLLRHLRET